MQPYSSDGSVRTSPHARPLEAIRASTLEAGDKMSRCGLDVGHGRGHPSGLLRSFSRGAWTAVALGVLVTLTGCPPPNYHPPIVKDGKECGTTSGWIWRATWWNFYERGQSWAECDLLDYAIDDFREAIERREADQRHARTYGMHFLDDYFPHRELGIALYRQGKLEDAENELKGSLGAEPSARAKYYLNEVRRSGLRRQGLGPLPGPAIHLDGAATFATREPSVWISGRARSNQYVERLEINGKAELIELAEPEQPFRAEVPVDLGDNTVRIVTTDLLGNRSETVISITGDREGPVVAIQSIEAVADGRLELIGSAHDPAGLAHLEVAGVQSAPNLPSSALLKLRLARPADDRIAFRAVDRLGNETSGTIVLEGSAGGAAPVARGLGPRPVLVASLDSDLPAPTAAFGGTPADPVDTSRLLAASSLNEIRWKLGEKLDTALDRSPPIVRIDGLTDTQTVYLDRILVTGNASDDSRVKTISVNAKELQFTPGRHVFFSSLVPLNDGANEIRVATTDLTGKRSERVVHVERKRPAIEDPSIRLAVASMPFREGEETLSSWSQVMQQFLVDGLVDQRRYRVVDRQVIDKVMQERKLSASDLVDPNEALDLAKLTPAEAILVGRAYRRGPSLEAWVKIIDTETSLELAIEDVYGENAATGDLKPLMAALAQKLALAIPRLEAPVIAVDGDQVRIARGAADKLRTGLAVAVFHRSAPAPAIDGGLPTGFSLDRVASGRVSEVTSASAQAVVHVTAPRTNVSVGDLLLVR